MWRRSDSEGRLEANLVMCGSRVVLEVGGRRWSDRRGRLEV